MDASMAHQEQRVVSPPNQTRCGSSSKKMPLSMMANPSAAASASDRAAPPMPPPMMHSHHMNQTQHAMMPQQEQHYAATNSSMAPSAAWGQHHQQGYHHPHAPPPPMRYAHHPTNINMPPPPPPSSSYRGRGVHDEFIFQAGPPRQQSYQRLPPCASDYNQHPQQRHAYHYPTALPPHTMAHQHHHSMPPNVNGIPSPNHELPTHVTPQFKRSVVSRGSSTGSHDHNVGSISSTPQSSSALKSDIEGGATTTTHRHRVAKGGEKKDKLAPVDAIFAAAEVIAKRPSPSPLNGELSGSSRALVQAATTPQPKRPFKKRKVATPNSDSGSTYTPTHPNKKTAGTTKKKSRSTSKSISPEQDKALSERALFLSQTIEVEPGLYRELLLHMALQRETPRKSPPTTIATPTGGVSTPDSHGNTTKPSSTSNGTASTATASASAAAVSPESNNCCPTNFPEVVSIGKRRGNQYVEGVRTFAGDSTLDKVITDGFFWKDVPELESILQRFMEEYYEMSENRPQSKKQQQFNNRLVNIVHKTALQSGYTFDPLSFGSSGSTPLAQTQTDPTASAPSTNINKKCNNKDLGDNFNYKKLRDRIRCYYKTHVQNSKKRLVTLLKNPTRPKNRQVLIKIVEDVKAQAVSDDNGVGRKLSPNGKAALKRLEARENGYDPDQQQTNHCIWHVATTPVSAQSVPDQQAGVAQSKPSYSTALPLTNTTGNETKVGWHQTPECDGPPTPRRVSMKAGDYNFKPAGSAMNAEPPVFASPCKPEHVAILQSIRQMSVPRQIF